MYKSMQSRLSPTPIGSRRRSLPLTKIERESVQALPIEKFHFTNGDFHYILPHDATPCGSDGSKFDKFLLHRWNEAKKSGALQYDLNLLYKTLPGKFGLSAQLNMERAMHRRKPHSFRNMNEPFDSRRFNFIKIQPDEVLFEMLDDHDQSHECDGDERKHSDAELHSPLANPSVPAALSNSNRSVILVNNSPIERGHSLLVPFIDKCLPQRITFDGMKLALETMLLSSCRLFFLVYNSLLGHASVNHLHFHLYYWPYVSRIVTWPVSHISGPLYELESWLISGFVLQLRNTDVDGFAKKIVSLIQFFHQKLVPHNMFIARAPNLSLLQTWPKKKPEEGHEKNHCNNDETPLATSANVGRDSSDEDGEDEKHHSLLREAPLYLTVYIFPRKAAFGAKPTMNFTPAACECAGHLLIYTSTFFQAVHEARIVHIVDEEAALEDGVFEQLREDLKKHIAFANLV